MKKLIKKHQIGNVIALRALSATQGNKNFWNADDMSTLSKINAFIKVLRGDVVNDCINSATGWTTDGKHTIASNKSLYNNPEKYGYTKVNYKDLLPGDIIQYVTDLNEPHHAGIVTSINPDGGISVKSSNGSDKMNPLRVYDSSGLDMRGGLYENIKNASYYRYVRNKEVGYSGGGFSGGGGKTW